MSAVLLFQRPVSAEDRRAAHSKWLLDMKRYSIWVLAGLLLLGAIAYMRLNSQTVQAIDETLLEGASDCSSCTARHKAYARSKKALSKKQIDIE